MAAIRLKKILIQNPKLIKGYHLLALVQMKEGEYNKARKTLRKAARIDKTNTTTLRFLREIDEQTGVSTRLERQNKRNRKAVDSRFLSIKKKEGFRCFLHWLPDFVQDCWRFIFWLFLPYVRESTGKRISRL